MVVRATRVTLCTAVLAVTVGLQPVRVAVVRGRSMEPTYQTGDLLFTAPAMGPLRNGDVVVAVVDGIPMVKRVQRVAGEGLVQCFFGGEWIDIETPTAIRSALKQRYPLHISVVPDDHVFLAGDNQADSYDSYDMGPVPLSAVKRRVLDSKPYDREKLDWSAPSPGGPMRGVEVSAVLVSAAICPRVAPTSDTVAVR